MPPQRAARSGPTPLAAVLSGLAAGAFGTAAMDGFLFRDYRRGGGKSSFRDWELSAGVSGWEDAPAPAQVGKRIVEGLFQTKLPASSAQLVDNVTHWAYGIAVAGGYGVLAGSLPVPRIRYGLPFAAAVWASSYVILPAIKLYKPIWEYDRETLAKDLGAHLVYGLATSTAFRALTSSR